MRTSTVVATCNVLDRLGAADARDAVETVLSAGPDIVALQEWRPSRRRLLPREDYLWVAPAYGGNPVGARRDRYALERHRLRVVGWVGRADRGARPVPVLPPRVVSVVLLRDRLLDRTVSVVGFHLVPGVQSRGRYRTDRPLLAARHQAEVRRLQALVEAQLERGHVVVAAGDSNFHGLRLPGLTSAWEGREAGPGTLGSHRKIDDVFAVGRATSVRLLATPSDHRAVLATRPDIG
jgi:endonuclease/exonuclease/phosphatase family metal-dependent hydrolase